MGRSEEYSAQELAQFARDQRDPVFVEWLAAMDEQLALFFERDVPGMTVDPWSEEGLRFAEQAALRSYWEREPNDFTWIEGREDRFARYLGEVFVRCFEGSWRWVAVWPQDSLEKKPVVLEPSTPLYLEVEKHVTAAIFERSGEKWSRLFRYSQEGYVEWVAAGRLPPKEWEQYRSEQSWKRHGG